MNAVVFGRKTWDAMGRKPLKNRINIILSSSSSKEIGISKEHENTLQIGHFEDIFALSETQS